MDDKKCASCYSTEDLLPSPTGGYICKKCFQDGLKEVVEHFNNLSKEQKDTPPEFEEVFRKNFRKLLVRS